MLPPEEAGSSCENTSPSFRTEQWMTALIKDVKHHQIHQPQQEGPDANWLTQHNLNYKIDNETIQLINKP